MNYLILLLFLVASPGLLAAEDWKYDIRDSLVEKTDEKGNKSYSVDMNVIDYYINRISVHAKEYPPKFESEEQRKNISDKLSILIKTLEIFGKNQQRNPEILARSAFVNSMGHNLDFENASKNAKLQYEKLLKLVPDSPLANYQYGMFLSGTSKYHFDGIPYLEKALSLGQDDARYTLGLLYFQKGEKDKGMKMLEEYSKSNPKNKHVKKTIKAIKNGTLKFQSS